MKLFDYANKTVTDSAALPPEACRSEKLFVLCRTHELPVLRDAFNFDPSTVLDCTDLDESVRYTTFDGYDFISIVHIEMQLESLLLREINIYISSKYLILVMPQHDSPRLKIMESRLQTYAGSPEGREPSLTSLYFWIFHNLLTDFSDTLEAMEDRMQLLFESIISSVSKKQFEEINSIRNMAYTAKKQLRALSYLGDQIVLDENRLIPKQQAQHFRSVTTRQKKLHDFAESLYNLSTEMLYTYDSRLTMKTNDTVNKLAALTLFFGPLTVITGIYGMNFDFMPELHSPLGYPLTLLAMAAVSVCLFIVLKKKEWL